MGVPTLMGTTVRHRGWGDRDRGSHRERSHWGGEKKPLNQLLSRGGQRGDSPTKKRRSSNLTAGSEQVGPREMEEGEIEVEEGEIVEAIRRVPPIHSGRDADRRGPPVPMATTWSTKKKRSSLKWGPREVEEGEIVEDDGPSSSFPHAISRAPTIHSGRDAGRRGPPVTMATPCSTKKRRSSPPTSLKWGPRGVEEGEIVSSSSIPPAISRVPPIHSSSTVSSSSVGPMHPSKPSGGNHGDSEQRGHKGDGKTVPASDPLREALVAARHILEQRRLLSKSNTSQSSMHGGGGGSSTSEVHSSPCLDVSSWEMGEGVKEIERRIQVVLGDCRTRFDGVIDAASLGRFFGGYGSFLLPD